MKLLITSDRPLILTMYRGLLEFYDGGIKINKKKLLAEGPRKNIKVTFGEGPLGLNMEMLNDQYW